MPVFQLPDELVFPPVELADPSGVLAVGGDLSPARLRLAYASGIFPWFNEDDPIMWWAPNPRFVLYPDQLKVSKSMKQVLRKGLFRVTFDQHFAGVIEACQQIYRPGQGGTWITDEMRVAYMALHEDGIAHSVEVWQNDALVGGLYGVSLGKAFFGESMFAKASNASKTGFIYLVQGLQRLGFHLIDCQVYTDHLASLGAVLIPREQFMQELDGALARQTYEGNWQALMG